MGNQITKIDNILLSKEMMDKMKNARSEADVRNCVERIFKIADIDTSGELPSDEELAKLFIECGILAITVAGGIAIESATDGSMTSLVIKAIRVVGKKVIKDFIQMLKKMKLYSKDFYGAVLNNSPYDAVIPGWEKSCHDTADDHKGIFLMHGEIDYLTVEMKDNQYQAFVKGSKPKGDVGCYCGLFHFKREDGWKVTGTEGILRFNLNGFAIDLHAACPLTSHSNRIYLHDAYTNKTMFEANKSLFNYWDNYHNKQTHYEEKWKDMIVSGTVNYTSSTADKAYGIACFVKV